VGWCGVSEFDREASTVRRPWPTGGCSATGAKKKKATIDLPSSPSSAVSQVMPMLCVMR